VASAYSHVCLMELFLQCGTELICSISDRDLALSDHHVA
jgi:hypothetical protein